MNPVKRNVPPAPAVSVIVPAYNSGECICACIDSLLAQTCGDLEVLVVDDGSTDSTPKKLAGYSRDARVRVIRQGNSGVSAARNNALAVACGEYAAFVDSDDVMHPRFVETALALAREENLDFVLYDLLEFKDGDVPAFGSVDGIAVDRIDAPLAYYLDNGFKGGMSSMFVRRSLLAGLFFPVGVSRGEDLCFSFSLLPRLAKGARVHAPLYFYRRTAGSLDSAGMGIRDVEAFVGIIRTLHDIYSAAGTESLRLIRRTLFPKLVKNLVKRGVRRAIAADAAAMEASIASLVRDGVVDYGGFTLRWRWYLWRISRRGRKS